MPITRSIRKITQPLLGTNTTAFNPASYGTPVIWLDCSSSAYCLDSGGNPADPDEAVQTLTDRSGNSREGLQTTVARQGVWRSSVQNSLGAIDVAASSSNWYSLQNSTSVTQNIGGLTLAYVFNPQDLSPFFCTMNMFMRNGDWEPRVRLRLIDQDGTNYQISFAGRRLDADALSVVTPGTNYAKDVWRILVIVVDYTNALLSMYVNGAELYAPTAFLTSGSTSNTASDINSPLGIQDPGLSFAYDGQLGEYVVYQAALDATNRGGLTAALGTKWGITVS